ncbi:MAG: hypothetical protein ACLFUJ_12750 [Phycisphaerae bacterium]
MKQLLPSILVALVAATSGCVKYTQPNDQGPELTDRQKRYQAIWQASREVLDEFRFQIDQVDARAGTIITEPMVTAAPFEFWRDELTTSRARKLSALHKTYALAIVTIGPSGQADDAYKPYTRVLFARSNQQHLQLTSAAGIGMVFTGGGIPLDYGEDTAELLTEAARDSTFQLPRESQPQDGTHPELPGLSSLGRLTDLEARIDQKIQRRAQEIFNRMN